jgi:hypothetical protein
MFEAPFHSFDDANQRDAAMSRAATHPLAQA